MIERLRREERRHSREPGGSARNMVAACESFLDHLKSPNRDAALFSFEDTERLNWTYLPGHRRGLPLGRMTSGDKNRLQQLLRTGLSEQGASTATAIIEHELILGMLETQQGLDSSWRDPSLYHLSVFGEPDGTSEWAWRFEGHHLSLHFTLLGDTLMSTTPSFFGANPARVPSGSQQGLRIFAPLEDPARSLMSSLEEAQRMRALFRIQRRATSSPRRNVASAWGKPRVCLPRRCRASNVLCSEL